MIRSSRALSMLCFPNITSLSWDCAGKLKAVFCVRSRISLRRKSPAWQAVRSMMTPSSRFARFAENGFRRKQMTYLSPFFRETSVMWKSWPHLTSPSLTSLVTWIPSKLLNTEETFLRTRTSISGSCLEPTGEFSS